MENYYSNPKWFQDRNKKLIEDKKSGKFTNAELVAKYGISQARIRQIINKFGKVKNDQR